MCKMYKQLRTFINYYTTTKIIPAAFIKMCRREWPGVSCKGFAQLNNFSSKGGQRKQALLADGWLKADKFPPPAHCEGFLVLTSPWRLVLGDGLKKFCKKEISLLKRMFSFSRMYCFSRGDTSSPKRAWLSCQICLFTSTAQALYRSLSAITSFSFFSGTCNPESSHTVSYTAPHLPDCPCNTWLPTGGT